MDGRTLPHAQDPWIILHELAHLLSPEVGHGRDFARTLLTLVDRFLGTEAGRTLRAAYKETGIKYCARRSVA
jgi:putative metallohydrolase (TIGR04338 family)